MSKNIMLLIGYLNNGGAEKSIVKLSRELSKKHNVCFVVAHKENKDYKTTLPVYEVPELRKIRTKFIGIYKIRKLKKKLNIDTSISYTTVFNFVNVLSKYRDKTIISIRNYLSLKEKNILYKILHKISVRFCDLVVCCSKAVMNDQIKNYNAPLDKLTVIENFCDASYIEKLANKKVNYKNYIMTISRLEYHKGLFELIDGFNIVLESNPNLKLLIFGRGPLKNKLEEKIKELKIEKNVFLMGFDNNPYKYLKNSRGFILNSYYEGFSNSIIEAMSCFCPVCALNSPGGNKETLCDGVYGDNKELFTYGILYKNKDEISSSIIKMINNYDYYSKLSYKRSLNYTSDRIMEKWFKIL